MTIKFTDENFEELVINSTKPVLIDFWSERCGPCRMIAPIIEELAKDYENVAVIGKVNVDENPDLTAKYGIRNIPTILFVKNGEILGRHVGAAAKLILNDKLKTYL
ncbi:MAG: thioredoxin [Bacteroidetes bacterium]|nr:thioredoxin [Bacteroidota bacterium]